MKLLELTVILFSMMVLVSDCRCDDDKRELAAQLFKGSRGTGTFALLYTSNVQGSVEPCGCTSQPLGGIARLATVVLAAEEYFDLGTAFIDGGSLLFGTKDNIHKADTCQEEARVDLLLKTFNQLGLVGTFDREFDNAMGVEFRDRSYEKNNLKNLRSAPDGILTGTSNLKIGIFFIDEKTQKVGLISKGLIGKGAKAIVAISFLSKAQTSLLEDVADFVDVVILAADTSETPPLAEKLTNGPVFVSIGRQGQYVGALEFNLAEIGASPGKWSFDNRQQENELRAALLNERKNALLKEIAQTEDLKKREYLNGRVKDAESQLDDIANARDLEPISSNFIVARTIALSRKIPSHPKFHEFLQRYEISIPSLVQACESDLECPTVSADEPRYVGAESCKTCHANAYEFWKKAVIKVNVSDDAGKPIAVQSGHSKAFETLEEKSKTLDRSCIGCHSVGFMKPGGFCKVKEVNEFKDVQCESCHGPGSKHIQTANPQLIKRSVPESVCRSCHHVPHIPTEESFVYNEKLEHILGIGHGESFLKKLKHGSSKDLTKNEQ